MSGGAGENARERACDEALARLRLTAGLVLLAPGALARHDPGELQERAGRTARTAARMSARLHGSAGLSPLDGAADDILLGADPDRLSHVASVAGALWYANDVAAIVERDARRKLIDLIGAEARQFVLQNRVAAPPVAPVGLASLFDTIVRTAAVCRDAWIATLPPGLRKRLVLIHGRPAEPDPDRPAETALKLFRQAAVHLEVGP